MKKGDALKYCQIVTKEIVAGGYKKTYKVFKTYRFDL